MTLTQTAKEIAQDVAETQRKSFQAGKARIQQVADVNTEKMVPEGVDAYRDIVKYNLKSQTKLGDKMVKHMAEAEQVPSQVKDAAKRLTAMAHELADSQADLVDKFCDLLIKAYPEEAVKNIGDALGQPGEKVREAAKKMVDMEKEFMDSLLKAAKQNGKKAAPKPPSKKSPSKAKKKTTTRKKTSSTRARKSSSSTKKSSA